MYVFVVIKLYGRKDEKYMQALYYMFTLSKQCDMTHDLKILLLTCQNGRKEL